LNGSVLTTGLFDQAYKLAFQWLVLKYRTEPVNLNPLGCIMLTEYEPPYRAMIIHVEIAGELSTRVLEDIHRLNQHYGKVESEWRSPLHSLYFQISPVRSISQNRIL
jgi:hypothetical protein